MFDADSNSKVTMEELLTIAKIKMVRYKPGHKQIHIGFTKKENEMKIIIAMSWSIMCDNKFG